MKKGTGRNSSLQVFRRPAVLLSVLLIVGVVFLLLYESQVGPQQSGQIVIDWRLKITIHDSRTLLNYTLPLIGVPGGLWMNHTLDSWGPPGYAPVSVRDASGTIWIQSTVPQPYNFADLFNIAGLRFDSQCVPNGQGGEYCSVTAPPAMSDGNTDRCINRGLYLSNNKDWAILINSSLGRSLGC